MLSTVAALKAATTLLAATTDAIAVDLEGVNLGRTGRIATLQMCGKARDTTYIVDVAVLGADAFGEEAGLRRLLESPLVSKLFFDVRSDANALFHHFGVDMPPESIVDLQLLDTGHNVMGGRMVERVGGLGFIFEHSPHARLTVRERERMAEVKESARRLFLPEHGGSYEVWLTRPLTPLLLEYATDARHFHALRESLSTRLKGPKAAAALAAAVDRRLVLAHSLDFSSANRDDNVRVDPLLVAALAAVRAAEKRGQAKGHGCG